MLRPAITQLISKNDSYYSLVIGVAKRAREIADELAVETITFSIDTTKNSRKLLKKNRSRQLLKNSQQESIKFWNISRQITMKIDFNGGA